jgi:hypothetical protein
MALNRAEGEEHQRGQGDGGLVRVKRKTTKIFSGKSKEEEKNPHDSFFLSFRRIYLIAAAEHNLGYLSATAALGSGATTRIDN